jgi:hypothetical protein
MHEVCGANQALSLLNLDSNYCAHVFSQTIESNTERTIDSSQHKEKINL